MEIRPICTPCSRDDGVRVEAQVIFNGTSLCRKHLSMAEKEIEELETAWGMS